MTQQFNTWSALTEEALIALPPGLAAVQIRRTRGLVEYPGGKSAMVCMYASKNIEASLRRLFARELERPGFYGQGPLLFRFLVSEEAEVVAGRRMQAFVNRFAEPPVLQQEILGSSPA